MVEAGQPPHTGDRMTLKFRDEQEHETNTVTGEVLRRFWYNDHSFTFHLDAGDGYLTVRYESGLEKYHVVGYGHVTAYELH